MQETQTPPIALTVRAARARAGWLLRGKVGRGRFTKHDAHYDPRRGQVTIGIWLVDRAAAEYQPSLWPMHRATLHWRRHDVVVDKALNYEFQIDREVPFANLTAVSFLPNAMTFDFGEDMHIAVGMSEIALTCRRTDAVRTDWGVRGWTYAIGAKAPIAAARG
jgi:hypothetical protein